MKTTTENTFPKASVMRFADKIEYADGGVVSKQVLKNDAGNITLFAFDEEQGLAEHTALQAAGRFKMLLTMIKG